MTTSPAIPGPTNSLLDVAGLRVGQASRTEPGWLTGVTVVLPPPAGAVAGVDVRGGGPGTRETDLLDPRNLVERVHAIVLSGGSALGLAAADGVARALFADGIGHPVGGLGEVVPIVPAAILFDLGRGGVFGHAPDAALGRAAYDAAGGPEAGRVTMGPLEVGTLEVGTLEMGMLEMGTVGAGTGALVGGLKGGIGTASAVLPDGTTVAALVAVNAVGSAVDPATGTPYAAAWCRPGDLPPLRPPDPAEVAAARSLAAERGGRTPLATTIGVVATDATLTKAQCARLAGQGHDGLARAIHPVHTLYDGDTLFGLATGARPAPDPAAHHLLLTEAGDVVTRAVARALLAATSAGGMRSYADALPSALADS